MQDRNSYHLHARRIEPVRQHYAEANAPQKPRVPHWVKGLVIIACIGLAGALTGCGGGGESSAPVLAGAMIAAPVSAVTGSWRAGVAAGCAVGLAKEINDMRSPIHNAAYVELSELIRQQLAESRGLSHRDYSHYTPRLMTQKKSQDACAAWLKSKD